MRHFNRTAAAIGLLVAIHACVIAQTRSTPNNPYTTAPDRPIVPAPPTATMRFPNPPTGFIPFTPAPPARANDVVAVPAKVELKSGQTLAGELQVTGPLECETIIGVTGIPANTIKGIRQHDQSDGDESGKAAATVVLANNDSLTVTVRVHHFLVKTEWGTAIINTAHVKSILLTIENVEWRDAGGRWHLDKTDEIQKSP